MSFVDEFVDIAACDTMRGKYGTTIFQKREALGKYYEPVCERIADYEIVADQAVNGIWGHGWNLENALKGAGYDVETVFMLIEVKYGKLPDDLV